MIETVTLKESGASHYPKELRSDDKFYFELQTPDEGMDTIIHDWCGVNNEGSLEADRDVLADAIEAGMISDRRCGVCYSELSQLYKKLYIEV